MSLIAYVKRRFYLGLSFFVLGVFLIAHYALAQTVPQIVRSQQNPAVQTFVLSSQSSAYNITPVAQVFPVKKGQTSFVQIIPAFRAGRGLAVAPDTQTLTFEQKAEAYWIVFNLFNRNQAKTRWVIDLGGRDSGTTGTADRIAVYTDAFPAHPVLNDGRKTPFKRHPEGLARNAVPVTLEAGQHRTVGIYIEPTQGMKPALNLRIEEQGAFQDTHEIRQLKRTILNVVVALASAMFLLFWFNYRRSNPGFVAAYLLLSYALYLTTDEMISAGNNTRVEMIGLLFALHGFTALALTRFITVPAHDPQTAAARRCDLILTLAQGALLAGGALAMFSTLDGAAIFMLGRVMPIVLPVLSAALAVYAYQQGNSMQTLPYAAAWLVFLAGCIAMETGTGMTHGSLTLWLSFVPHFVLLSYTVLRQLVQSEALIRQREIDNARHIEEEREQQKTRELTEQSRLLSAMQREKELVEDLRQREFERIQALKREKEVADKANRDKSDFLAVISHEIRTPMTGIMGIVHLLLDSKLDAHQREHVEELKYSGERLLTLLNDILDLSKVEKGKMTFEHINFDLQKFVKSVTFLMTARAGEKKLNLITNIDPSMPPFLKGDPTRLGQVLLNLISNAIKFTPQGSITVTVSPHDMKQKRPRIYFAVSDTGIGISAEAQKKLFTPYTQADESVTRNFGGTGLGLSLCKNIVEAMGGTIQIQSEPNKGTTIYFIVPMETGEAPSVTAEEARMNVTPVNVLVVDDNSINLKVVEALLKRDGHTIVTVNSGEDAIAAVLKSSFDIVLMDMEMPLMDGLETTRKIRALNDPEKSSVTVIAMTANTRREDIEKCREAGMNDHIAKPINPEQMRKALAFFAQDAAKNKPAAPAPEIAPAPSPETAPAPVSSAAPVEQQTALPEKSSLSLENETADADVPPAPAPEKTPEKPAEPVYKAIPAAPLTAAPAAANKMFNTDVLGGLKESLGAPQMDEMMDGLYQKTEELIAAVEAAVENKDTRALVGRGHDIKGMTANFGLSALSELAARLERQAREEFPLDKLAEIAAQLRPVYYDTRSALDKWLKEPS